jgi:hypothetical protein
LFWIAVMGAGLTGLTLGIGRTGPWREFAKLVPFLGRSDEGTGNQSLIALMLRLGYRQDSTPCHVITLAGALVLVGLIVLIFRRSPREYRTSPPLVLAASAALIAWVLIFSPLTWNKYYLFLFPFWGWLVWEARHGKGRFIVVSLALLSTWGSWQVMVPFDLPEPLNSHMLWGAMAIVAIAVARLAVPAPVPSSEVPA